MALKGKGKLTERTGQSSSFYQFCYRVFSLATADWAEKRVIYFPFEILPYTQIPGIGFPQYLHFPALRLISPTIYPVRWMIIFLHFGQNVFSPS
jgi:hypothetical protein